MQTLFMLPSSLQQPYRYISNRAPSLTGTASHECKHYSQTLSRMPAPGPKHCRHAIVMTNGRLGPRRRHRTPAQLHLFVCASYSIGRLTARATLPHLRLCFSCTNCVSCASRASSAALGETPRGCATKHRRPLSILTRSPSPRL